MSRLTRRALCLGMSLLLLTGLSRAQTLRIGSWERKTDPLVQVSEAVLAQAYGELQQPVDFLELPLRRALQMLLSGELDGNVFRVAGLALKEPGLYRVATPIAISEVRAYGLDPKLKPKTWAELAGLRVGYLRGTLVIETSLPAACRPVAAKSMAELFRMLKLDMVDLVLHAELVQDEPNPLAAGAAAHRLEQPLDSLPVYHYLTGRHQELGKRLDAVLKRMEASGEAQVIRIKAQAAMP